MINKKDILLIKHFMGETTPEEELIVAQYKQNNKAEYKALKKFWLAEGSIKPVNFNTQKAFDKVKSRVKKGHSVKVVSLFSRVKQISVAASILLFIGLGTFWWLQENNKPQMVMTNPITTVGGKTVTLPDGSLVTLNKNASLSFPKQFKGSKRIVKLSGEAFFEVSKDKKHPFVIEMNDSEVVVLGTSFNIKNNKQQTEVSVTTGKVRVKALDNNQSVDIIPGQSARVSNHSLEKFTTTNTNYMSWKTGQFTFLNTPINQVIKDLNSYYATKIVSENLKSNSCKITAKFNKKPLLEVIEILQLTCDVELKTNPQK